MSRHRPIHRPAAPDAARRAGLDAGYALVRAGAGASLLLANGGAAWGREDGPATDHEFATVVTSATGLDDGRPMCEQDHPRMARHPLRRVPVVFRIWHSAPPTPWRARWWSWWSLGIW